MQTRLAIFNAYSGWIEEPEELVRELCSCHGAQLHGTGPKGATTTAWAHAMHTESIEEHESEVNMATFLNLHSDGICLVTTPEPVVNFPAGGAPKSSFGINVDFLRALKGGIFLMKMPLC